MSKQCGYCRMVGHDVRHCDIKKNQILIIRRHVGSERVALHDLIVKNGYGVGSMVEVNTYRGVIPCVVTSLVDTFTSYYTNDIIEWRMHRYRRSVGCTLTSWTGNMSTGDVTISDDYVRFRKKPTITLVARPLSDLSDTVYATLMIRDLPYHPDSYNEVFGYQWESSNTRLLAPSSETDVGNEELMKTFPVHVRLAKDSRSTHVRFAPIMP